MKNLKIKFGLFSLLAILAASLFLTSCEQETILDDIMVEQAVMDGEIMESDEIFEFSVPDGMSEEATVEWLNNLSYDEAQSIGKLINPSQVESRYYCGPWSPPIRYNTIALCYGCGNPPFKHKYYHRQYRYCYYPNGVRVTRYRYFSTYSCKNYC